MTLSSCSLWKGYKHHYSIRHVVPRMIFTFSHSHLGVMLNYGVVSAEIPCIVLFSMHSILPLATWSHADAVHHTCPCDVLSTAGHGSGSMRTYTVIAPVLSAPSIFHTARPNRSCTHTACCVVYNIL